MSSTALGRLIRRLIAVIAFALTPIASALAQGESFPSRPVRIVVGFAAGAFNDIMVRTIAPRMSERLGQPVIVENRAGAGGNIAAETVARAAPDGYTLLSAPTSTYVINPLIYTKLAYDAERDFLPVSHIANFGLFLAVPGELPVRTLGELIAHAKAHPAKANFASVAPSFDLMTAMLSKKTGVVFERLPFKSTAETMTALLTDQAMIAYQDHNSMAPHLRTGKVRALLTLSSRRTAELPEVPTGKEAGFDYLEFDSLTGIAVPRGTPAGIISKLESAIVDSIRAPEVIERWRTLGMIPVGSTAAEFAATLEAERRRWAEVQQTTGIKLD